MKIKCPACAKVLSIPESAAGQVVKCPCGKQLRAPSPTGSQPSAASLGGSAAGGGAARSPSPRPNSGGGAIDPGIFDDLTDNDLQPVKTSSNPYQSPSGVSASNLHSAGPQELASVGSRIGGALLDGLFSVLIMLPGLIIGGGIMVASVASAGGQNMAPEEGAAIAAGGMITGFLIIAANALLPLIINCVLIAKSGQSLGKKVVGTRMVDQNSGETVGFVQGFLVRTFVFQLITGIPVVGGFVALADIVFLFTEGNQTLHDRLAKTRVVRA